LKALRYSVCIIVGKDIADKTQLYEIEISVFSLSFNERKNIYFKLFQIKGKLEKKKNKQTLQILYSSACFLKCSDVTTTLEGFKTSQKN